MCTIPQRQLYLVYTWPLCLVITSFVTMLSNLLLAHYTVYCIVVSEVLRRPG